MSFRVAMLSFHTSPLAALGRTRNAGGMNVYVAQLAQELGREEIAVDIFTRRAEPNTPFIQTLSEHVRLLSLDAGPPEILPPEDLLPYLAEFTQRVASFAAHAPRRYDLVHSHYWLSGMAGLSLASRWDVPHVTMYHTVEQLKHAEKLPRRRVSQNEHITRLRIEHERRIAQEADRIIVSTEHEAEHLRRLYGLAPDALRIVPCGVDLRVFTPGDAAASAPMRAALSPDGRPVLLFVGRLDPIKGIDLLLESVARLRTPARLVVVGGDPPHDPEVEQLRAYAETLGISERVSFPGAVPQEELPAYYRAADALVVTSRYESFGLVAVEALACGVPVVAARVGGLPTIVRHGENGLLVDWRCPQAFADAIERVVGDAEYRAGLADQARASVTAFDWHHIGDHMRALYQELTAEHSRIAACSCF